MPPSAVEAIAQEASRNGQILGVRLAETGDADDAKPWNRRPSRRPRAARVTEPLLAEVRAVIGQRLFVEKTGLPSPILNQIKRLAAFQNPEFYKKQNLRLSTALTPRIIACAEDDGQYIALPKGCQGELESALGEYGVALVVEDKRDLGGKLGVRFRGQLTSVQEQAARALLAHDMGVVVAPPGVGKTVLGTYLVAQRGRRTLVLVHRRPLLDQWVAQLAMFLGIEEGEIGRIGGGKRKHNCRLTTFRANGRISGSPCTDQFAFYPAGEKFLPELSKLFEEGWKVKLTGAAALPESVPCFLLVLEK